MRVQSRLVDESVRAWARGWCHALASAVRVHAIYVVASRTCRVEQYNTVDSQYSTPKLPRLVPLSTWLFMVVILLEGP